jgi:hypothetical protein
MSKYSVTSTNGLVFWVVNNQTNQSVSNTYTDRYMAERVCDRLNLQNDLEKL